MHLCDVTRYDERAQREGKSPSDWIKAICDFIRLIETSACGHSTVIKARFTYHEPHDDIIIIILLSIRRSC